MRHCCVLFLLPVFCCNLWFHPNRGSVILIAIIPLSYSDTLKKITENYTKMNGWSGVKSKLLAAFALFHPISARATPSRIAAIARYEAARKPFHSFFDRSYLKLTLSMFLRLCNSFQAH